MTLDISTSVTPEDHERVYRSLLSQFETWRSEHDWCTDLYLFVGQLSRVFHWNALATGVYYGYSGEMTYDPARLPEDTDSARAQDLRELRGRILRMTLDRSDYINLARANEFLEDSGLPRHDKKTPGRIYVNLSGYAPGDETTPEKLQAEVQEYLTRIGAEGVTIATYREHRTSYIDFPDTTELLPQPGTSGY